MEPRLIALWLYLDQLGVSSDIETVSDRKRVQKAVYLGQLSGVDFGYRFGWYLMGPYSTTLTQDYYEMAEAINLGENDYQNMELRSSIRNKLDKIAPLLKKPDSVNLQDEQWLELVASYHYLIKVRLSSNEEALNTLKEEKSLLIDYVSTAKKELTKAGLLP